MSDKYYRLTMGERVVGFITRYNVVVKSAAQSWLLNKSIYTVYDWAQRKGYQVEEVSYPGC